MIYHSVKWVRCGLFSGGELFLWKGSLERDPQVMCKNMPRRKSEHRRIAVFRSEVTGLETKPLVKRRNCALRIARLANVTLATKIELISFRAPESDHHGCTKCNMRKLAFFRASSKCRHKSRSAPSPNYKSVGDEPPSPLQCAAARQPMMALLLGSIEAP